MNGPLSVNDTAGCPASPVDQVLFWRQVLALLSAVLVVTTSMEIVSELEGSWSLPDCVGSLLVLWIVTIVLGLPFIALGLKLARRHGIGLRLVVQPVPVGRTTWLHAIAVIHGALMVNAAGAMALLMIRIRRGPHPSTDVIEVHSLWRALTLSASAGVVEEIIFRLFLLGLFLWLARRMGMKSSAAFWLANILSAALFAYTHTLGYGQPLYEQLLPEIIGMHLLGGLVLGWLARQEGLEAAILAHWEWDLVLLLLSLGRS